MSSLPHALAIFQDFGDVSGYKLNMHKSELLIISSKARDISFETFQVKVKADHLTYLGIKSYLRKTLPPFLNALGQTFRDGVISHFH